MCLVVYSNAQIQRAEENITVYKVMRKVSDNEWITPYQKMKVDKPFKSMPIFAEGEVYRYKYYDKYNFFHAIEGGLIHAYKTLPIALCHVLFHEDSIWEMIIPKGTEFIEGCKFEIAAKEMVFERVIPGENSY